MLVHSASTEPDKYVFVLHGFALVVKSGQPGPGNKRTWSAPDLHMNAMTLDYLGFFQQLEQTEVVHGHRHRGSTLKIHTVE